jgi:hypothetical protein
MKNRIVPALAATMLAMGTLALATAAPAQADVSVSVTCVPPGGTTTLTVSPGETITFLDSTIGGCGAEAFVGAVDLYSYDNSDANLQTVTINSDLAPGLYEDAVYFVGDAIYHFNLLVTAPSTTTIPDWVQAYGRASATDSCLTGWNPSWAMWPNNGTGGFVCQRSIPSLG